MRRRKELEELTEIQLERMRIIRQALMDEGRPQGAGRRFLAMILMDLCVFDRVEYDNQAQLAMRNYGIQLLEDAGINTVRNLHELLDAWLNIPVPELPGPERRLPRQEVPRGGILKTILGA